MTNETTIGGVIEAPDARRGFTAARTLVFTSAQNNTKLHEGFFAALQMYCRERDAELHISRFTYDTRQRFQKPGTQEVIDGDVWYPEEIIPYISDAAIQITPDLVWCGELNIIPTMQYPLSSLKSYTRNASGIIPHVKMHMESVPTQKSDPARFLYTTGAVTQRNYIQKRAGQVAEFHHVFGAIVVEIDDNNNWWARQLNADRTGAFHDLNRLYDPTMEHSEQRQIVAITHGDIHIGKRDNAVLSEVFGEGGVVDMLRPSYQFFHDLVDFTARNHHNIKDPHFMREFRYLVVEEEFRQGLILLDQAERPWSKNVVITSNHDMAIDLWLKNTDAHHDTSPNASFWYRMNLLKLRYSGMNIFALALHEANKSLEYCLHYKVVAEDESFCIDEIEYGLHGHLGPNGARGNPKNLKFLGKANTAHTHSAGIVDGVYTAGVYGRLDMTYNKGPSSWSHSAIITHANAKRQIITANRTGKFWRNQ